MVSEWRARGGGLEAVQGAVDILEGRSSEAQGGLGRSEIDLVLILEEAAKKNRQRFYIYLQVKDVPKQDPKTPVPVSLWLHQAPSKPSGRKPGSDQTQWLEIVDIDSLRHAVVSAATKRGGLA